MKKTIIFLGFTAVLFCAAFIDKKPVKIFMAGDSTMAPKKPERYPETGWGEAFGNYFTNEVTVVNLAMNGRSTKSFINENRWQKLIDDVSPDDYVLIQFGHNDEKVNSPKLGTTLEEYEVNLTRFVREVKEKKAFPILLTPVMRRSFKNGSFYNSHGEYPEIVKKVAITENVVLIDMLEKSRQLLEEKGPQGSKELYLIADSGKLVNYPKGIFDNTHFSEAGANEMAKLVVNALKEQRIALAEWLKP